MGQILKKEYDAAYKLGGLKAQMRLAVITKMPISKAKKAEDSAENLKFFTNAMQKIKQEFNY